MSKPFKIQPYTRSDKHILITGPEGFRLYVDFDDVDPIASVEILYEMIRVLNNHSWSTTLAKITLKQKEAYDEL